MNERKRICWVVTGAGHFLPETADVIASLRNVSVDLYFTRAGEEVAARYGLTEKLTSAAEKMYRENDASSGDIIYFSGGRYEALVIAPATANTVAKCVLGIADSLASNFFAQAGKSGVPVIVLPTDSASEITTTTISGRKITVRPRPVDLRRTDELSLFPGVTLAVTTGEIAELLE